MISNYPCLKEIRCRQCETIHYLTRPTNSDSIDDRNIKYVKNLLLHSNNEHAHLFLSLHVTFLRKRTGICSDKNIAVLIKKSESEINKRRVNLIT